ncbi:MAG: hypothetical protein ACRDYY_13025, partial [Acidimicrobiales bacterium]
MPDPWTAEPSEDPSDPGSPPAFERRALQASLADLVRSGSSTAAFSPGSAGPGETGRGTSGREALAALAAAVAQTAPAVEVDEEESGTGTSPLRRPPAAAPGPAGPVAGPV